MVDFCFPIYPYITFMFLFILKDSTDWIYYPELNSFQKNISYIWILKKPNVIWIDADGEMLSWHLSFFSFRDCSFPIIGTNILVSGWRELKSPALPPAGGPWANSLTSLGLSSFVYKRNGRAAVFSVLKSCGSMLKPLLHPAGIDMISLHWQMSRFYTAGNSTPLSPPVQKRLYCDPFQWVDALPKAVPTR